MRHNIECLHFGKKGSGLFFRTFRNNFPNGKGYCFRLKFNDHIHLLIGAINPDRFTGNLYDDIVIQVTSEAVGIYSADEQMDMVVKLQPEAVSLAIREIVPEGSEEKAASFFSEMQALNIVPQFILYSVEDLHRCDDLIRNAIIPFSNPFLQLVLGRYAAGQQSHPRDLIPFVEALDAKRHWSVCAFGPLEHAAASCALAMGGHVRVGFENNMMLKSGNIAGNNAELVRQAREVTEAIGRPLATANDLRRMF